MGKHSYSKLFSVICVSIFFLVGENAVGANYAIRTSSKRAQRATPTTTIAPATTVPTTTLPVATTAVPGTTSPPTTVPAGSPGGYPARGSVGVPPGQALTVMSPANGTYFNVTSDTIYDGADMRGGIYFTGSVLTIRNSRVSPDGSKWYGGIVMANSGSTLVIEDSTISVVNAALSSTGNPDAIRGARVEVSRTDIFGAVDGLKFSSGWIRDSWIHDLYAGNGNHNDGIQIMGGANLEFTRNRIELYDDVSKFNASNHNAALFFQPYGIGSSISNVTIANNYFVGGYYALRIESNTKGGPSTGFTVVGNVFGPPPSGGSYYLLTGSPGITQWANNVTGDIAGTPSTTSVG